MAGSTVRLALAAAGTLVVSLLGASIADAKPARPKAAHSQRTVCGAPADGRSFERSSQAPPFSRKVRVRTSLVVHRHIMAKLQRNQVNRIIDDDAAISPAVSGYDTLLLLDALEPIGMLAVPQCQPKSHRGVLRRSPRGPPDVTCLA